MTALLALFRAIAAGDHRSARHLVEASPELARQAASLGATRHASSEFFLAEIGHYIYAGDTALHIAAAAYAPAIAERLVANGANVRARNRRGAEPLHYAVDGNPNSPAWNPAAQEAMVAWLIDAGADPNAADKSGVTPLHRAVRTRCAAAVRTLLAKGANSLSPNGSGSTPLDLAVRTTGRGGSGSAASRAQQQEIIRMLQRRG